MRSSKKRKPYDSSVYRSLVLITQFGINMVVPIGMMSALGIWLDRRYGTSFWTILLFFAGAAAGGQNIYRMAKRVYMETPEEEPEGAGRDGGAAGIGRAAGQSGTAGAGRVAGQSGPVGAGRAGGQSGDAGAAGPVGKEGGERK